MYSGSDRWHLDGVDLKKILVSFLLALSGFLAAFWTAYVEPELMGKPSIWVLLIATGGPFLINVVRKWAQKQGRLLGTSRQIVVKLDEVPLEGLPANEDAAVYPTKLPQIAIKRESEEAGED